MNLLQKTERAIRSIQLVFWGALAGLVLGTILGTLATRYWYTTLARPGPAGDSQTPRVAISPSATMETVKSTTKSQGIQITVKGHTKGPARLTKSATIRSEAPIKTGEDKIIAAKETIGGPTPQISGSEEAKIAPGSTVGGTVGESQESDQTLGGGGDGQPPGVDAAPVDSVPTEIPPAAFHVGDHAEGTVDGELEIVDAAGRPITTEPLTVSGEYTLDFPAPGQAELDLRFTAPAVLSVELPRLTRPADPLRSIRLAVSAGWFVDRPFATVTGEYIRRWPIVGGLSVLAGGEAGWAWTPERDRPVGQIIAGIEYRF